MSEISLYIDSHLVWKRAKRIFSRRMWMVFGFGLNHTSESSVRANYTIYLPSFLPCSYPLLCGFPTCWHPLHHKGTITYSQSIAYRIFERKGSVMDIHRVNVITLNGSEHDGQSFKQWYGFYAFTGGTVFKF
jgi:hypothetical protein